MPKLSIVESPLAEAAARLYPDDLGPGIQEELAAVADIENRYEVTLARESGRPVSDRVKNRVKQQIERWHWQKREPHVLRLAELHQRMIAVTFFGPRRVH